MMRGGNAQDRRRTRRAAERFASRSSADPDLAEVQALAADASGTAVHAAEPLPEEALLEAFDLRIFAIGDVAWGPEEGFADLLCDLNESLGSDESGEGSEPVEYAPRPHAVDVSVKLDKALLCLPDGGMVVAPLAISRDGEPTLGAPDSWLPVERALVEAAPDADEADAAVAAAARMRFTLRDFLITDSGTSVNSEFAPTDVVLPAEHQPGQTIPERNPSPAAPEPTLHDGNAVAWEALFLPEATLTDDGRAFAPGSITWRELPLTLMAMTETGPGGHEGAEIAGRIDRIWRDGNQIKAAGVFDAGEYGSEISRMVADGTLRGLSVDTAIHEFQVGPRSDYFTDDGKWIEQAAAADDAEEPDVLDLLFGDDDTDRIFVVTKAVIGMATVCPFPAFAEANISLAASGAVWTYSHQGGFIVTRQKPAAALVAAVAVAAETEVEGEADPGESLTAGAAGLVPVAPPADWFQNPTLEELTPLTITDDGRIFGHAWAWDTCHLAFPDSCVLAPRSNTENAYFHLGEIECEDGETVAVGKITLDTGHAGQNASRAQAISHYDHTGTVAAHVRCGEDEHGGWIAGAVNPEITEEKLRILRGASLSGDWRAVRTSSGRSNLELVALLAVNVPGFPVPRQPKALVASSEEGQEVLALVAAGIVGEQTPADPDLAAISDIVAIADIARNAPCASCGD